MSNKVTPTAPQGEGYNPDGSPQVAVVSQDYPVVMQPANVPVTYPGPPPEPVEDHMCLSCGVCWFVNWPLGLAALIFSYLASHNADKTKAASQAKIALWLNIAGIVMTSILVLVFIIVALT